MLFTEVATGRMNSEGGKKVALEDSGRVILRQQRQSLVAKDKIDLLPGCAAWEEETYSAVVLNCSFYTHCTVCSQEGKKRKPNPELNNGNAEEFGLPDPMDLLKLLAYVCY